ncbi:CDP-diacylglycerol--glycerol-3-phosphate 3-phosphatidyltransferase [Ruminococcus bromii]|nr:CDP-diacylglycerol--glycerol-3-phosphate 3-phosphatidyltransferase [Ruminococcus bromii]
MNLPNKLTVGRIILVPFFVAALLANFPLNNAVALIIFIAASLTDMFDGKIARKNGLVTDFGKFADPLADKILVLAALLCFVQLGICDCVAVIIVLFREFSVTSIRLIAASKGKVVAANMWGKAKTVSQMIAIIAVIAMQIVLELPEVGLNFINAATFEPIFFVAGEILIWISVVFTIISGVVYIIQNRQFISQT